MNHFDKIVGTKIRYSIVTGRQYAKVHAVRLGWETGDPDPWNNCHHWTNSQIARYEKAEAYHLAILHAKCGYYFPTVRGVHIDPEKLRQLAVERSFLFLGYAPTP